MIKPIHEYVNTLISAKRYDIMNEGLFGKKNKPEIIMSGITFKGKEIKIKTYHKNDISEEKEKIKETINIVEKELEYLKKYTADTIFDFDEEYDNKNYIEKIKSTFKNSYNLSRQLEIVDIGFSVAYQRKTKILWNEYYIFLNTKSKFFKRDYCIIASINDKTKELDKSYHHCDNTYNWF